MFLRLQPFRVLILFLAVVALLANSSCSRSESENRGNLPIGFVDAPKNGAAVKGTLSAVGWAVSEDGIEGVSVYLDRVFAGSGSMGQARPDVLKALPQFKNDPNPGWNASVDVNKLTPGIHELTIQVRSNNGAFAISASCR